MITVDVHQMFYLGLRHPSDLYNPHTLHLTSDIEANNEHKHLCTLLLSV